MNIIVSPAEARAVRSCYAQGIGVETRFLVERYNSLPGTVFGNRLFEHVDKVRGSRTWIERNGMLADAVFWWRHVGQVRVAWDVGLGEEADHRTQEATSLNKASPQLFSRRRDVLARKRHDYFPKIHLHTILARRYSMETKVVISAL